MDILYASTFKSNETENEVEERPNPNTELRFLHNAFMT